MDKAVLKIKKGLKEGIFQLPSNFQNAEDGKGLVNATFKQGP